MSQALKNPAWLAVLLALAALIVAIITWQQGRITYTIAYTDSTETSTFSSGTPFNAIINGKSIPVDALSAVRVKIWNSGNQTIDAGVLDPRILVRSVDGNIVDIEIERHNMTDTPVITRCTLQFCEITSGRLLPNMGYELVLLVQGAKGNDGVKVSAAASSVVAFRETLNFGRWIDFYFWGLIVLPLMTVVRDVLTLSENKRAESRGEPAPEPHWINRIADNGRALPRTLASLYILMLAVAAFIVAPCIFLYIMFIEPKPPF